MRTEGLRGIRSTGGWLCLKVSGFHFLSKRLFRDGTTEYRDCDGFVQSCPSTLPGLVGQHPELFAPVDASLNEAGFRKSGYSIFGGPL